MEMKLKIEEVQSQKRSERIAAHTHVKGLGLDENGDANDESQGLVGQHDARKAVGLIVQMIEMKKMVGRALLFAGVPASGKTALAMAVSKELGSDVPFCPMTGSEVYSSEVKKTEVLMENLRRSIGLKIREVKQVIEGVVEDVKPIETNDLKRGYGKKVSGVVVSLRTEKDVKVLKMHPSVYTNLQKAKVAIGDVVFIEQASGNVKRVGRCNINSDESDLEADEYVPTPKGEVYKKKEVIQHVTLHDLDMANCNPHEGSDALSIVSKLMKSKKTEVTEKLRTEINKLVDEYIDRGVAELIPGVLFIDEVHMLDLECFSFLNKCLESNLAPIIIFATNRGKYKIKGTDVVSPHGIPVDFMDRITIVQTKPYNQQEMEQILRIRAKYEDIDIAPSALTELAKIGVKSSLRHAAQLLTPCQIIADTHARSTVEKADVSECNDTFLDTKSSVKYIKKHQDGYLL